MAPVTNVTPRGDLHPTAGRPLGIACALGRSSRCRAAQSVSALLGQPGSSPERVVGKAIRNRATQPPIRVQLPTLRPVLRRRSAPARRRPRAHRLRLETRTPPCGELCQFFRLCCSAHFWFQRKISRLRLSRAATALTSPFLSTPRARTRKADARVPGSWKEAIWL
jgi:hypothetical protein